MQAARTQAVGLSLLVVSLLLAVGLQLPPLQRWATLVPWMLLWGLLAFSGCAVVSYRLVPSPWADPGERGGDAASAEDDGSPEQQIRRMLRLDGLLHPATLVPLATAVVSVTYLLLGTDWVRGVGAVIVMVISLLTGATSFIWRYAIRDGNEYEHLEQQLMVAREGERERQEEQQTQSLRSKLEHGFAETASAAGARIFAELEREYAQLRPALESRREADPLSVVRIPALAAETYRRGLSVLVDALELTEAIQGSGRDRLQAEIAELERETARSEVEPAAPERVEIREATLASHRDRVAMLDRLQLLIDQLLHQTGRCEASLHRTRIELAAIRAGSSEASVDSVIEALQGTIRQAKEVQTQLTKLGY